MYDIMTMMKLKLKSFDNRQSLPDMQDIEWLVENHGDKIKANQGELNYEHVETFIEAVTEKHGENDDTDRIKRALGAVWPAEE